ncbi:hypothetical protein K443DRAFT_681481 [Laccaria amethystina LaAM-08-1]|uniref:Uncharacterized protein n=1 Tax=Laccaria amethystina LaAM-08-1 TaxID=1095629 RepID=A0A0C9XN65_9AGAR|nr:hypothetical protein K443DRAFT_681481 [Laccaria amethystina LaAM-08-1]
MGWTGNSWTIRSSLSGLYVGLAGSAGNGTRLVVSAAPFQWDIWHDTADPRTYRIFVPYTHFNWISRTVEVQLSIHLPRSGISMKMALFTRRGHLTDYDYLSSLNDVIDNQKHPVFYVPHPRVLSTADYSS